MIRINLLPVREISAEFGRRQELMLGGLVLAVTVIAIGLVYLMQIRRISSLETELATLRQEVEALNAKAKGVSDMERRVADLQSKLKVIEELNRKKSGPVQIMQSLSSATPARLWLTQFRESSGNVTIEGMAVDNQTIAEFMKALAKSPHFEKVELVETAQSEQGGMPLQRFSINSMLIYQVPTPDDEKEGAKK